MAFSFPQRARELAEGLACRLSAARSDRSGNFGLMFALLAAPMIFGMGVSFDYMHAYGIRTRMQADLDAAIIAAVKDVDTLTEDNIKARVKVWYNAQGKSSDVAYSIDTDTMSISKTNRTIQATVTAVVPTSLMKIFGISSVNVQVASTVSGPATEYLNVYIVLDKSASMLLAATSAGQTTMTNKTSCNFACHEVEGGPWTINGQSYTTRYAVAKALGVTLRADLAVTAAQEVISMIDSADSQHTRIKVGLYTLGSTATQVLAPTYTTSQATSALSTDSKGMNSATSIAYSYFDKSLPTLASFVGSGGDGSTASTPKKLVLMLTDGVESERDWVTYNPSGKWYCTKTVSGACVKYNSTYFPYQYKVSPLNPTWCKSMKDASVTVGVLYTEYLSIDTDWGYNGTVGDTMASSGFTSLWGGTMHTGVSTSTTRRDYIPYALEDCATSSDLFLSASDETAIESGLASIFSQYLGSVRLTQ